MMNESKSIAPETVNYDVYPSSDSNSNIFPDVEVIGNKFYGNFPIDFFSSCLVDYSGKQFSCIHDNCKGHNNCFNEDTLADNFNFHELYFHQDDRKLWCDKVFPDILKYISAESNVENSDYRFIFNHRYIRMDGSISQFMHEGSITLVNDRKSACFKPEGIFRNCRH